MKVADMRTARARYLRRRRNRYAAFQAVDICPHLRTIDIRDKRELKKAEEFFHENNRIF